MDGIEQQTTMLERCQMPAQEIEWVLTAGDPNVVHMLLELHAERLREELVERITALSEVETSIARAERRLATRSA